MNKIEQDYLNYPRMLWLWLYMEYLILVDLSYGLDWTCSGKELILLTTGTCNREKKTYS